MPKLIFSLILLALCPGLHAQDNDAGFGSVKKIDLSEDGKSSGPNHLVMMLNLKKAAPGQLGQVILYQFSKRSRLDFEADKLPKGEYVLAYAANCYSTKLTSGWKELHRFSSAQTHIQTEKSLPQASVTEPRKGAVMLRGKFLGLFRVKPAMLIDCKVIQ